MIKKWALKVKKGTSGTPRLNLRIWLFNLILKVNTSGEAKKDHNIKYRRPITAWWMTNQTTIDYYYILPCPTVYLRHNLFSRKQTSSWLLLLTCIARENWPFNHTHAFGFHLQAFNNWVCWRQLSFCRPIVHMLVVHAHNLQSSEYTPTWIWADWSVYVIFSKLQNWPPKIELPRAMDLSVGTTSLPLFITVHGCRALCPDNAIQVVVFTSSKHCSTGG